MSDPASNRRDDPQLRADLIRAIPNLRAFAISLSGDASHADDLVQETLLKAWSHLATFETGTNLKAWLFTILRNSYFSNHRKRRHEVEDVDGYLTEGLATAPDQLSHMDLLDLGAALAKLPSDQREAVILVGAEGFSYEDVATIAGCAVGTVKSRVSRARARLCELLRLESGGAESSPGQKVQKPEKPNVCDAAAGVDEKPSEMDEKPMAETGQEATPG